MKDRTQQINRAKSISLFAFARLAGTVNIYNCTTLSPGNSVGCIVARVLQCNLCSNRWRSSLCNKPRLFNDQDRRQGKNRNGTYSSWFFRGLSAPQKPIFKERGDISDAKNISFIRNLDYFFVFKL
jgi:hypothetical protein